MSLWHASLECVNSLCPCDAIWRHRFWSTLAQVMAWCLTASGHYSNQCWLVISQVWGQTHNHQSPKLARKFIVKNFIWILSELSFQTASAQPMQNQHICVTFVNYHNITFVWHLVLRGLHWASISTKRKISWSLEAATFGLYPSLWNSTGTSTAALPICLSNFNAIWSL